MKNKEPIKDNIDFTYVNGVSIGVYSKNVVVTLEVAKEAVIKRKAISNNKLSPMLIDGRSVKEVKKDARDYFSSTEGEELLSAAALLINSAFTSAIANFLTKFSFKKNAVPIKIFSNKEEALYWLKKYL